MIFQKILKLGEGRAVLQRHDLKGNPHFHAGGHGGSHRDIAHTRHVKAEIKDGVLTLRLLLDKESVELFINGGERVVTSLIPTPLEAEGITFAVDAPLPVSISAHHLK